MTDNRSRYQAGKTIKDTEYGVKFPDGSVLWFAGSMSDLSTTEDREAYIKNRELNLRGLGIKDPGVEFLQRVKKTSFSEPQPVAG